jgi:hypothetical protein
MRNVLLAMRFIVMAMFIPLWNTPSGAQQAIQDVKRCVEGAYVLEEFKLDGEVFKAPQIVGRFIVLNGTVTYIFHDRTKQSSQKSYVGIGKYTVTASGYSYSYDDFTTYTHAAEGTTISRQLPFEGMLLFAPALESDGMHLRHPEPPQSDFHCSTSNGLTFNFGAGNYRKYRRTGPE